MTVAITGASTGERCHGAGIPGNDDQEEPMGAVRGVEVESLRILTMTIALKPTLTGICAVLMLSRHGSNYTFHTFDLHT